MLWIIWSSTIYMIISWKNRKMMKRTNLYYDFLSRSLRLSWWVFKWEETTSTPWCSTINFLLLYMVFKGFHQVRALIDGSIYTIPQRVPRQGAIRRPHIDENWALIFRHSSPRQPFTRVLQEGSNTRSTRKSGCWGVPKSPGAQQGGGRRMSPFWRILRAPQYRVSVETLNFRLFFILP